MKRAISLLLVLLVGLGLAAGQDKKKDKAILPTLVVRAQYVYVTTYDGPDTSPDVLPADRQAFVAVQDAIRQWGKYRLTSRERDADLILLVHSTTTSGPNSRVDDELTVFQGSSGLNSSPLWRGMAAGGLQGPSPALVQHLRADVEEAEKALQEQKKQKP